MTEIKKGFNIAEVETTNIPAMLPEWNDTQYNKVESVLSALFVGKRLTDHRGNVKTIRNMNDIENFFGLPYTSSSSFAMISNTNTRFCFDTNNEYNFDCVGLGEDGNVYLYCENDDNEEKIYKVLQ